MHLQAGSIKSHTQEKHDSPLTREMLVDNTKIIDSVPNLRKLKYLEAIILYINMYKPSLNIQGINAIVLPSDREIRTQNVN